MELTMYRAKLKTSGKTPEQILALYDEPMPDGKEVDSWIQVYNNLNGIEVAVMKDFTGDDYILGLWKDEDDSKVMEYFYLAEQDPLFGSYIDDREEFLNDWKAKEYLPSATLILAKDDIEIIEKLKNKETE